jgi:cytochrome c oxidase subunit 3
MNGTAVEQPGPLEAGAAQRDDLVQLGVWMFLATVVMLFAAFTSAYIVRRSASDWTPIELPGILWVNSAMLIASSGVLESARRGARRPDGAATRAQLSTGAGLGALFLAGQVAAWRQLAERGVYVASNPHSSFFFVLTGAHGVHVVAGLTLLVYSAVRCRHLGSASRARLVTASATFWHFLAVIWIYVLVLVSVF